MLTLHGRFIQWPYIIPRRTGGSEDAKELLFLYRQTHPTGIIPPFGLSREFLDSPSDIVRIMTRVYALWKSLVLFICLHYMTVDCQGNICSPSPQSYNLKCSYTSSIFHYHIATWEKQMGSNFRFLQSIVSQKKGSLKIYHFASPHERLTPTLCHLFNCQ